jgi:DNA-binding FadR family transcriptional regulator
MEAVAANHGSADLVVLLRRLMDAGPSDIFIVRQIVEPQAAAAAVSNGTGADIAAIVEAHEKAVASETLDGFEHWDAALHRRIFAATRNELLINLQDILSAIRDKPSWRRIKNSTITRDVQAKYCGEHAAIVEAIASRSAQDAHAAMKRHLLSVVHDMFPE